MIESRAAIISMESKSSQMIITALKKYFSYVDSLNIKDIEVTLGTQSEVLYKGKPIPTYDCVYAKGSYKFANLLTSVTSVLLNKTYLPLKPQTYITANDKLLTHLELQRHSIPMPKTYIAATPEGAKQILEKINYPIVMKFPQGTHGKGVMFADSYSSASSMLDALSALKQAFIIQEYIDTSGVDIRAFVVGNEVVASMIRTAVQGEKRANIHAGGSGEACQLDYHTKKIALDTAAAIGAEICAVDILKGVKGPLVLEVNYSPGLQGITAATGIDVADKIARHLYSHTKSILESNKAKQASRIMDEIGVATESVKNSKEFITTIILRGKRIILPDIVSDITQFNDKEPLIFEVAKDKLSITKFDMGKKK